MATRAIPRRGARRIPRMPAVAGPARGPLALGALFLGAALICAFTLRRGIDPFDEGLVLQAARRVASGQHPYGDFTWAYGPAYPYLLGGLFKLFGVSLMQWRVVWALASAGAATVAYALTSRLAGPRWALVAWLAVACQLAEPRTANPFPAALLCALGALLAAVGERLGWAALLTAAAAAFRLDFALYALAAIAVMALLRQRRLRPALVYVAIALGLTLLVYLPFVIADGPGRVWDALVATSLRERDWWTLPFPWSYQGVAGSAKGLKKLLDFYVPALLVAGLAAAALATLWRRLPPVWTALCVFAAGGLSYLLSRSDEFHTTPLLVALAVLLPAIAARGPRPVTIAVAVLLALLTLHGVGNRLSALANPPALRTVHVAPADGAEAPPREAASIERVVRLVDARIPPGQPFYVAPARSDLVRYSNAILYVLARRPNATDRDFGLLSRRGEQRDVVAQLARTRPQAIVRWTDPLGDSREPNLRGRPSGVHLLDRWIAANYRTTAVLYHYTLLVPR